MRSDRSTRPRSCALVCTSVCVLPLITVAQTQITPDPSDPEVPVAPTRYESVFTRSPERSDIDDPQLPWKRLFNPDGTFVPETKLGRVQESASGGMDRSGSTESEIALPESVSDGRGVVRAIYPERNKVKLKHGPIEKLGMPGMTMVFRVENPALLEGIEEGEALGFTIEMQGTAFVITGFQSADDSESESAQPLLAVGTTNSIESGSESAVSDGGSDARGVVKGIYRDRNKVKLKHGPIEKLDMPGMTMVFRVKDPTLLEDIGEGEELGFTIEMQGTSFVITGFQK